MLDMPSSILSVNSDLFTLKMLKKVLFFLSLYGLFSTNQDVQERRQTTKKILQNVDGLLWLTRIIDLKLLIMFFV
jgi:hypothetical protein